MRKNSPLSQPPNGLPKHPEDWSLGSDRARVTPVSSTHAAQSFVEEVHIGNRMDGVDRSDWPDPYMLKQDVAHAEERTAGNVRKSGDTKQGSRDHGKTAIQNFRE